MTKFCQTLSLNFPVFYKRMNIGLSCKSKFSHPGMSIIFWFGQKPLILTGAKQLIFYYEANMSPENLQRSDGKLDVVY